MPGESLSFPIVAEDRASSSFRSVGRAAEGAAVKMDLAAASAKLWNDTTIKQGKAAATSEAAMKSHAKAAGLLADTENVLAGRATKTTKLMADQGRELDNTAAKAEAAAFSFSSLAGGGGIPGGGIGALIGAGVALSPILATVGTGLLGFGAAAVGVGAPILKAAQATGGLSANLSKLNPEQRQVAQGLLGLGQQFAAFQKQMQPAVFTVFNEGIHLAGTLLHGVEPVAKATGTALGGMLARIDQEFASGTWQQFFQFMATTAGPDIKLLGDNFVLLLNDLPPLIESLQGFATTLLKDTAGVLSLIGGIEKLVAEQHKLQDEVAHSSGWLGRLKDAVVQAAKEMVPGAFGAKQVADQLGRLGAQSDTARRSLHVTAPALTTVGLEAKAASAHLQDMTTWVNNLNTAETNSLNTQLAYSNALITGATDAQKLRAALKASHDQVGLHTAAERASFSTANTYISDLENTAKQAIASGRGASGAARAIQNGLPILEQAARHNHLLWQEVQTLKNWLDKLRREGPIAEKINVLGLGKWSVAAASHAIAQGPGPFASGGLVSGGTPGRDSVPIMAMPGEAVVPTRLTPAVAPFLKAHGVPGFASGGVVGSYRGDVAGLPPWSRGNLNATAHLIDLAVVKATVAGIRAAQSQAFGGGSGGPASGAVRALQAYAASLFPQYGWSQAQLPALIALWNGESGWNPMARNPSSGAFGIPQALPPGKMGALAASGNAAAQIRWGEGYIASTYGSPIGAYNMWLNRSPHWYDHGGWLPPGLSLAMNATGRPERVGGHGDITVNVHVSPLASPADTGRKVVEVIREFEKRSGSGWRR